MRICISTNNLFEDIHVVNEKQIVYVHCVPELAICKSKFDLTKFDEI